MTKKQKDMLKRILVTAVLYVALVAADHMKMISAVFTGWKMLFLYLIPYFVIGWDILYKAVRNIKNGQVFDENFLMAVATIGAFGVNEYSEAVAVMLFYQVGELFQSVVRRIVGEGGVVDHDRVYVRLPQRFGTGRIERVEADEQFFVIFRITNRVGKRCAKRVVSVGGHLFQCARRGPDVRVDAVCVPFGRACFSGRFVCMSVCATPFEQPDAPAQVDQFLPIGKIA